MALKTKIPHVPRAIVIAPHGLRNLTQSDFMIALALRAARQMLAALTDIAAWHRPEHSNCRCEKTGLIIDAFWKNNFAGVHPVAAQYLNQT